jgi:peptidyl-prolyl cis-trans isomerase SurA
MFERAAITLLFGLLSLSSFAQIQQAKSNKSTTLFTVNKRPVTVDEFIYLYKKNHHDRTKDFTKEKINEYLELFVNFKLKVEEARNRGLDTTKVFLKEFNGYKDELRKPYLPDAKIIDSLVKLTYARMKEEVNASHILVALKPDPVSRGYAQGLHKKYRYSGSDSKRHRFRAVGHRIIRRSFCKNE